MSTIIPYAPYVVIWALVCDPIAVAPTYVWVITENQKFLFERVHSMYFMASTLRF